MNHDGIFAGLQIQTPPTLEPLTTSEVETALRLPTTDPDTDAQVSAYITAVRKDFETIMHRAFLQQTWKLILKNWPGRSYINWPHAFTSAIDVYYKYNYIKLPFAPLQSVTSVRYMTSVGVTNSMIAANFTVQNGFTYNVNTTTEPGQIVLPFAQIWPTDILMPGAPIEITYVSGYQDLTHLQAWEGWDPTRQGMILVIGDCWENRIPAENAKNSKKMRVIDDWLTPFRVYD